MAMRNSKKTEDVNNNDDIKDGGYTKDNEDLIINKDDKNMVGINDGGKANAITSKTKIKMKRIEEWPI